MKGERISADSMTIRPKRLLAVPLFVLVAFFWVHAVIVAWVGQPGLAAVLAAVGLVIGFVPAHVLRLRTELRPEGIVERRLRGTELIPWTDVTRVTSVEFSEAVTVVRRDGRVRRLAGTFGKRPRRGPSLHEIVRAVQAGIDRHPVDHPVAGVERAVPVRIERRLGWRPVRGLIAGLTVFGVLAGAAGGQWSGWWVISALLLVVALLMVVATLRARTVIDADGIRNRPLNKETFIPWPDVKELVVSAAPSRYVQVVRHSGATKTLAAVRDGDVQPDGLTFDDVVEVMRRRADLETVSATKDERAPVTAAVPAGPVELRPSRRPLLWMVPVALALLVTPFFAFGDLDFVAVLGYWFIAPIGLLVVSVKLLRGRTVAGPNGIRNRLIGRTKEIPWDELDRFVVQPTLFGRVVHLRRINRNRIVLAAPREGLLGRDPRFDAGLESLRALAQVSGGGPAAIERISVKVGRVMLAIPLGFVLVVMLMLWRPWYSAWWPGQEQVGSLPSACVVTDAAAARLVPGGERAYAGRSGGRLIATSTCKWTGAQFADLDVEYDRRGRTSDASALSEAKDAFKQELRRRTSPAPTPVPGLGDEAWQSVETSRERTAAKVLVRYRNVIIDVEYQSVRPAGQVAAEAITVARQAVGRLRT